MMGASKALSKNNFPYGAGVAAHDAPRYPKVFRFAY